MMECAEDLLTLEEFSLSRRLRKNYTDMDGYTYDEVYLYAQGLVIHVVDGAPSLTIANCQYDGPLTSLEATLHEWYVAEYGT